eukprot:Em0004g1710a
MVHSEAMREALVCAQEVNSKLTRAIDANDRMAEQVETSRENATLIITQIFEQLHQTIEERKKTLLSVMESISLSKIAALTLQKEEWVKMQDEIGRYTEMTSHILQTHTDHEMVALGNLLPTELKAILQKVENMSLTPIQSNDIHVSLHTDSLIKELSIFGHSVAKVKEIYYVKVETMIAKGKRYPYGGVQVKAELKPKSHDGAVVPGEVKDIGDGTYTITLTPQTAGPHQLLITMDGQHVQKSPCDLDVGMKYSTLCNPEHVIYCNGGPSASQQKRTIGSGGYRDGQFHCPYILFIKGDVMYVVDQDNHRIQKLTTGGQFLQKFGQQGSGQGQFNHPASVIVDQRDRLHMALPWTLKGTFMLQPLVLTPSKSSHLRETYVRLYGDVKSPSGIFIDEEGYSCVNEMTV